VTDSPPSANALEEHTPSTPRHATTGTAKRRV